MMGKVMRWGPVILPYLALCMGLIDIRMTRQNVVRMHDLQATDGQTIDALRTQVASYERLINAQQNLLTERGKLIAALQARCVGQGPTDQTDGGI